MPKVSWLVQRNGMDAGRSLMYSLNGSEGNHQHANGLSVEFYGKGLTLGPDAGIGQSLYSGLDYLEYYSQFPSHNTVCVDGISSYPVMKSNHAFKLLHSYPQPSTAEERNLASENYFRGVCYTETYFREPESQADQTRLLSIVDTDGGGYYVDIFRSRKHEGGDKMHDYFYHNLGQTMSVTAVDGSPLDFAPSEELSFAGAHLYAYSYIYDQQMVQTDKDIRADFTVRPDAGGDDIRMTMWQQGMPGRKIFRALSPETEGLSRDNTMPYKIKGQPTLTYVARQTGEAWTRPFVSVFEPSVSSEGNSVSRVDFVRPEGADDAAGIEVTLKDGRKDFIGLLQSWQDGDVTLEGGGAPMGEDESPCLVCLSARERRYTRALVVGPWLAVPFGRDRGTFVRTGRRVHGTERRGMVLYSQSPLRNQVRWKDQKGKGDGLSCEVVSRYKILQNKRAAT